MIGEWEKIHQSRAWGKYPDIHMVRQVKKFLSGRPYPPVALDIGCGVGANSMMLCNEGIGVVAIDVSETALGRFPRHDMIIDAKVADAQTVEFDAESFDLIIDNFTLTYLEHPPWERILSWLKPGGWLVHASFELFPSGTPRAWAHQSPGHVVERHSSWVEGNAFTFAVRKYVKEKQQEEDLNLRNHKIRLIQRALDKTRGDQSAAAKMLGVDRKTVYQHLKASS